MAFKLNSILNEKTLSQAKDSHKVQYISREKILPNPYNNEVYSTNNIELLSYSIEESGLLEPLIVASNGDDTYTIISGHRRKEAIDMLCSRSDDMNKKFSLVPVIVRKNDSDIEETLLDGNLFNREKSDAEKAKEIAEKKKKLLQRKERGEKISGKLLDLIADEMNISVHQAKKLNAINNNASESVKNAFDEGKLSTEAAYQLSKADENTQEEIIVESSKPVTAKTVKERLDNTQSLSPTETDGKNTVKEVTESISSDGSVVNIALAEKALRDMLNIISTGGDIPLEKNQVAKLKKLLKTISDFVKACQKS